MNNKKHGNHWKGGKSIDKDGYLLVYMPKHPRARTNGYVLEHILVVEKACRRYLKDDEEIHHINGIRDDNRVINLVLCKDRAHHFYLHRSQRALDACNHADWLKCKYCKQWDSPENMCVYDHQGWHRECHIKYMREYHKHRREYYLTRG